MKYLMAFLFFLFSFSSINAQTDESIIKDLFFKLFDPLSFDLLNCQKDTLFIGSTIYETSFNYDSVTFENETGLKVPMKIITDFKKNIKGGSYSSFWNEKKLNETDTIFTGNDTVLVKKPAIKCLSRDEEKLLFEKTKKRQRLYKISKIIFDDSKENAVFELLYTPWLGDFSGHMIFIKKIFGRWIIIAEFDYVMT